jgi:hypothetical protein
VLKDTREVKALGFFEIMHVESRERLTKWVATSGLPTFVSIQQNVKVAAAAQGPTPDNGTSNLSLSNWSFQ